MNKVILCGRFTRDPESRMTSASMEVSRFSLACPSDFVNKDGQRETEFINCVAFGRTAQTLNKYCTKGSMILAQGRIRNSSYDAQDGTKRYVTEVVADNFEFLSSKNSGSGTASAPVNAYVDTTSSFYVDEPSKDNGVDISSEDPFKNFGNEVALSDDDLPF